MIQWTFLDTTFPRRPPRLQDQAWETTVTVSFQLSDEPSVCVGGTYPGCLVPALRIASFITDFFFPQISALWSLVYG